MYLRHARISGSRLASELPLFTLPLHPHSPAQFHSQSQPAAVFTAFPPQSHSQVCSPAPLDLLSLCASTQSLRQTQQVHAFAILHGLLPRSVSLSAALILRYAAFDSDHPTATLRVLFDQNAHFSRSPFLYNTLIRAHAVLGAEVSNGGFCVYNEMVRNGIVPDDYTFPFVLKLCSDLLEVDKGLEVHGFLIKVGSHGGVFVNNTLMMFYGCSGDLNAAERVFAAMPDRDLVSWNTIFRVFSEGGLGIKEIGFIKEMFSCSEIKPNAVTMMTLLPICAESDESWMTCVIHCYVVKVGLDGQLTVGNALVNAYGECGDLEASWQVFDEMTERNVVSWNAIICSFAHIGFNAEALFTFRLMIDDLLKPNTFTLSVMLPVLAELGLCSKGREVHAFSLRMGMNVDVFVANSLIVMYAKSDHPVEASNVFYQMQIRNAVSWNAMIANFAQNGLELDAIGLAREMQAHGEILNSVTITNVLPACARFGCLQPGKEIHSRVIRLGLDSDLFVSNALIDMYAKCGSLKHAQSLFDISFRDEVTYNILIVGYSQSNECVKSLSLFSEMGYLGLKHDNVSFVGVLSACVTIFALRSGQEIHAYSIRRLFHSHLFVANSLLDMYTKCGRIDLSRKIFDRMLKRDEASWNTMILGYGVLGEVDTAIDLFESMSKDGLQYDSVSYIAVLSACSHGGLVEKGKKYFGDMSVHNIKPSQVHYACMIDLLGRFGLIGEAVSLIKNLPIQPDANIWGALLGACRLHNYTDLGCWAAEHLLKLRPEHSGYYTLLSNMYAEAGKWDQADRVRELMTAKGVQKNPGRSWVQIEDVHAFGFGENLEGLG